MRILFVGGGTLGSVSPLLAVAEEIRARETTAELRWWGTRSGPERLLIEAAGMPFRALPAGKLRRYFDVRNFLDVPIIVGAFFAALIRLLQWRPDVIVGAGSFVQVPVMWAAACFRIPIVIHQQDVRPGFANRLVAPFAAAITATFQESTQAFGRHVEVIGNPVRRAVLDARNISPTEARRKFGLDPERATVLILGGGTGAQALNELVRNALPELTSVTNVIHVTGKGKLISTPPTPPPSGKGGKGEGVRGVETISPPPFGRGSEGGWGNHYRVFDLLTDDLPLAYAAADLVISRAGMGTIAELGALGKPTVLIPMPETHQEDNAAAMEDRGAMLVWHERDLTPNEFARRVIALLTDVAQRATLARQCAQVFPTDAAGKIAEIIQNIAKARKT
ncbi:MAG: UDP-N-acetylglucosamine--N-acetylmuramyl-(pentapeptide) pyrophosphoryl-undecaprenol N-acetylglucosamine transferase [Candidatus Uhrbacteria bacterium]